MRAIVEIAAEQGVNLKKALAGSGLDLGLLSQPYLLIPGREASKLTQRLMDMAGVEGIGFELGLRIKPTSHGYLGYALMSCSTLRQGAALLRKYLPLRTDHFTLQLRQEKERVAFLFSEAHDLGAQRRMLFEEMMTIVYQNASFLVGEPLRDCEMWFDWPEPAYADAYRDRMPQMRFEQESNRLLIPNRYMDMPLALADPAASKMALEQLRQEETQSGIAGKSTAAQVRALLVLQSHVGYPGLDTVAAKLFMSVRTLKRKLRESGTTFQKLLDEARCKDALRLMKNPNVDLKTVASILGYAEHICFTRAFRRWTGQTPSAFRQRAAGATDHG
ncbi:MAG: AraC family transcriptional regulator [Nevskia sp.]|nr:AraC family transcriptional regulator [Nevskia sp.]